jgi:hypothetical protein
MPARNVICLEFNELCPPLLEKWMGEGKLPNFKRFFESSHAFTATADDPDHYNNLEPWIQWYSMHTGLSFEQHRVYHLTGGPSAGHYDIWHMLLDHGLNVGNCASMNAKAFHAPGSFYLPDPWCVTESPYPEGLDVYQKIVTNRVRENSTGGDGSLTRSDYVRFLGFLADHGLRLKTVKALAAQLWSDTVRKEDTSWKRVPLLDKIQSDVFCYLWKKYRPAFATFFANSTAHFQHAYWHCLFPEQFDRPVAPAEREKFGGAILHGYQQMDALLSAFFELEQREGALLMLTGALSQHANPDSGDFFYRAKDIHQLFAILGIRANEVLPVMTEQFSAHFDSVEAAQDAQRRLSALRVNGKPVFSYGKARAGELFAGCRFHEEVPSGALLEGIPSGPVRFFDLLYNIPHTKSATHDPDSVLWIKTGTGKVFAEKVSILDVVPTLLDHFGLNREKVDPDHRLQGSSLLPLLAGNSHSRAQPQHA